MQQAQCKQAVQLLQAKCAPQGQRRERPLWAGFPGVLLGEGGELPFLCRLWPPPPCSHPEGLPEVHLVLHLQVMDRGRKEQGPAFLWSFFARQRGSSDQVPLLKSVAPTRWSSLASMVLLSLLARDSSSSMPLGPNAATSLAASPVSKPLP